MTIYILDEDPTKCAKALDDKSLDKMIKAIVQVLCNVHHFNLPAHNRYLGDRDLIALTPSKLPYDNKSTIGKWSQWARECRANYEELARYGGASLMEFSIRHANKIDPSKPIFSKHKYKQAIQWAIKNVPDLPKIVGMRNSDGEISDGAIYAHISKRDNNEFLGTPFPLVVPKKCFAGMFDYKDEEVKHDIIQSYRNYYQAKLTEKTICSQCEYEWASTPHECQKDGYKIPVWTYRKQPEWLDLEAACVDPKS